MEELLTDLDMVLAPTIRVYKLDDGSEIAEFIDIVGETVTFTMEQVHD